MEIGNKFIDDFGVELTLVEINELNEYVVSYYSEEHNQHVVSTYELNELENMKRIK